MELSKCIVLHGGQTGWLGVTLTFVHPLRNSLRSFADSFTTDKDMRYVLKERILLTCFIQLQEGIARSRNKIVNIILPYDATLLVDFISDLSKEPFAESCAASTRYSKKLGF